MTFDLPTLTLTLAPTLAADVGSHNCEIVARLDAYPDQSSTVLFTAIINPDPCLTVVWNNPII